jgi:hypothetical protein
VLKVAIISGSPGILSGSRPESLGFPAHRASAGSYGSSEYCDGLRYVLQSAQMQDRIATLQVGSSAPDFSLEAANREGEFSLLSLLRSGTLILQFLRGTW